MTEVMLTSGQGFEGYEIVEYLGFVNVQSELFQGVCSRCE